MMLDADDGPDVSQITTSHLGGRAANGFAVAGAACKADASGALWIEDGRVLVVADLHFEKGSAFAKRGTFLPPYDTVATLARLAAVAARYNPRMIVALGDSFHDVAGADRMAARDMAALKKLQSGRDWVWIAGNHDPVAAPALGGQACAELRLGPLTLRHEPLGGEQPGEIAGHLHPAARIAGRGISLRRRCFVTDGARCVLPAFGAFAGGLNIKDAAFKPLFPGQVMAHVLGKAQVYAVRGSRCVGEGRS